MYLFDRETFWAEAEDSAARYAEEVQLPPQLPRECLPSHYKRTSAEEHNL